MMATRVGGGMMRHGSELLTMCARCAADVECRHAAMHESPVRVDVAAYSTRAGERL